MRLNTFQLTTIQRTLTEVFGEGVPVLLFGSRANDESRGGDIDLLVETNLPCEEAVRRRIKALARLSLRMGEQRIDLVITPNIVNDERLIVKEAQKKGIKI